MNILFSSDDNYARHLGVAIYSLLDNSRDEDSVVVYVIDNGIGDCNKDRLQKVVDGFENASVEFISFDLCRDYLKLDMAWNISISAYGRLFVGILLPKEVDRILYMDCDMIVNNSLYDLWNADLNGCVLGAVQDDVNDFVKESVGLQPKDQYFNSGMLLIDLKKWRERLCDEKCLDFIKSKEGRVIHHDQGVLNGVFRNRWCRLHLRNNLMTIHYVFKRKQIMKFFHENAEFYTIDEINEAKMSPTILHYTPSFTSRPWVMGCKHPKKQLYWNVLDKTPWRGAKADKDSTKWYVKLINWRYRVLPYDIWN